MNISYHGMADALSRAELDSTLVTLTARWPVVGTTVQVGPLVPGKFCDIVTYITGDTDGTMGVTNSEHKVCDILVVDAYAKNFHRWQDKVREAQSKGMLASAPVIGEHPAQYVLTHEFGHALARNVIGEFEEHEHPYRVAQLMAWHAVGDATDVTSTRKVPDTFDDYWERIASSDGTWWPHLGEDLSHYACSSPTELVAEAFAVGSLAPGHSKAADALYAWIDDQYQAYAAKHHHYHAA